MEIGGRDGHRNRRSADGFDLEDFAVAARTLRDHTGEQISFAFRRSGGPADRRRTGRRARRGRLSARRCSARSPSGSAQPKATSSPCWPSARPSIRPACLRATSPNAWRCSSRRATASIRRCGAGRQSRPAGRRDFVALRRICGVDEEDLVAMVAEIRALNPRPGMAFSAGSTDTIIADVLIRPANDGTWQVELNAGRVAAGSGRSGLFRRSLAATPRTRPRRSFLPIACKAPIG